MTLRARLLLAAAMILAVVSIGAVVILRTQQAFLTEQLDDQLRAARPLFRAPPTGFNRDSPFEPPESPESPDEPVSSLFVGQIEDGTLVTVLRGQLLDDVPDLDPKEGITSGSSGEAFTVDGRDTETRFRVVLLQTDDAAIVSVVALPLDEVDGAIDQLRWALGGVTGAIAAVLTLAVWWVHRLGLRPVARVTAVADAIASGDRDRRVDGVDERTEAGRLARAFNVMLDERDTREEGLRQFVADASHELRTPLTSIRGYLDLYREGGFRGDGEFDDVVRRMAQESTRMQALVEDLLLLAKLDEHRPLRREPVDLRRLLWDAATDAEVLQPHRVLVVDVPDEPVEVTGDPYRLQQVVTILVANALVHTGPDVEIRLTAQPEPDGAALEVSDTGHGMAPADADRVFDRFYRGDRSRARSTGGSGLGLAIARSIVDAHEGVITLVTEPGRGCTFHVQLPRVQRELPKPQSPPE